MTFEIKNLSLQLKNGNRLLKDINFKINKGEIVGLVGESGSGKSLTGKSITRLNDENLFKYEGEILFDGRNVLTFNMKQLKKYYQHEVSMIFQDPQNSLNPLATIKTQLIESLEMAKKGSTVNSHQACHELLIKVGFKDEQVDTLLKSYPFELSGGMQQRVMIALALAKKPALLIADEPTTALDVTIQSNILKLLKQLNEADGLSILFVTHDLSVAQNLCDRILVMRNGEIVEIAKTETLFINPLAEYTIDLFSSIPGLTDSQLNKIEFMRKQRELILKKFEPVEHLIEIEDGHLVRLS